MLLVEQVLASIELAQKAAINLASAILNENDNLIGILSSDLKDLFASLYEIGEKLAKESANVKLDCLCLNFIDSLERLLKHLPLNPKLAHHKIEFELFPFLQTGFQHFYFWGCIYPDKDKMQNYYDLEKKQLFGNTYVEDSEKNGNYKYELSIGVLAYNKLDYTKMCVESILQTVPSDVKYELILVNNGSSDETKEYFESVRPTKQLDIKINGGLLYSVHRIIEGEYFINFSNDTIACANSIKNMLQAMRDEPMLGYAVPATSNITNLQCPIINYKTFDEMYKYAKENNEYNPLRHEQRARLCDPIGGLRSYNSLFIIGHAGHYFTNKMAFPDDVGSMLTRRAGYKNILVKDAFCHHFGSITVKNEIDNNTYIEGRKEFMKHFGFDPWGKGFCWDYELFSNLNITAQNNAKILGISPGIGSNPLKIKTLLREHGSDGIQLYIASEEEQFRVDYESYTDAQKVQIVEPTDFKNVFVGEKFNYIIVEISTSPTDVDSYKKRLLSGGTLIVWSSDLGVAKRLFQKSSKKIIQSGTGAWIVFR